MAQRLNDISAIHRSCDDCGEAIARAYIWPTGEQAGGQMVVLMLCQKCYRKRKYKK